MKMQRMGNSPIVDIPDEMAGRFKTAGYTEVGESNVDNIYQPSKAWKVSELKEYAASLGVDASKLRTKDKILALIGSAVEDKEGDESEDLEDEDEFEASDDEGAVDE